MYWSSENMDEFRGKFHRPAATCAKVIPQQGYTVQVTVCSVAYKAKVVSKCSAIYRY